MKKTLLSVLSMCLAILMLGALLCTSLASCTGNEETTAESTAPSNGAETSEGSTDEKKDPTSNDQSDTKEPDAEETTVSDADTDETVGDASSASTVDSGESNSSTESESSSSAPSTDETESKNEGNEEEDTNDIVGPVLEENVYTPSIEYANQMANGVQSYYTAADRLNYRIENLNMNLNYSLTDSKKVTSITNKQGGVYLQNTMDVFVTTEAGNRIYASSSASKIRPNIYRIGYYYYDVHMLEHNFQGDVIVNKEEAINGTYFNSTSAGIDKDNSGFKKNNLKVTISGSDPYIYNRTTTFNASDYNALQLTVKSTNCNMLYLYYVPGAEGGHTDTHRLSLSIVPDGEEHTYTFLMKGAPDFEGKIGKFRIDFEGTSTGEVIEISDVKLVDATSTGFDGLYLDRTYHTYSDKLHQELHFVATQKVTGIKEVGMVTEIAVDTVDKLIVKDSASELHTTLEGVDWASAEYVAFDIKGVGIFGYMLPVHDNAGSMTVELVEDKYVITQTVTPKDGTIDPIAVDDPNTDATEHKTVNTSNDFFTGNRIYTDENHSFEAFIAEAEFERAPLDNISSDAFLAYDALTGAYEFKIDGTGFNAPFFYDANNHYTINIKMRNKEVDRTLYIRSITSSGCLESAAILSDKNLVLPILTEVSKNFGGENEEPIFNCGDMTYGETIFPIVLPADEKFEINVINLYQNWGTVPLKQLSSIQYFWPYYHLSVGTTETSCIAPWYGARDLWTLPDFRSQSMPYWFELEPDKGYSNQPQHTHAGYQYFLQYTDADGIYNATENISNVIDSAGPVYVDTDMTYISDDGKIKVVYTHVEMPQEDELRAYYEINYEILEEVKIKDFANDFSFYSFEGYSGYYRKMGYWAEKGDEDGIVYKDTNGTATPEKLVLGNDCPYVALYDLNATGDWKNNNANMGFAIHSSNIVIDGVERNDNFVVMGKNYVYSLSMDLGEVTLKPGDTINLNMIITPWGHYNTTTDTSMQNIRENTCLNPLTVDVTYGEEIESVFVPKILSTDGKSAEFTLSGGTDNVVARVYGFNKLTNPIIYEKIDGEWVEYVVSSINTPDKMGNKHYYDGYYVYYEDDRTYSYAFAVDMTEHESRTFKVVVEEDFKRWPNIINDGSESPLNVFASSAIIYSITSGGFKGVSDVALSDDGSFVRFYGDGLGTGEAYFEAWKSNSDLNTGAYVVVKYRMPTTNVNSNYIQFYTTTDPDAPMPECTLSAGTSYTDGEWHVMIVDIIDKKHPHFKANEDGESFNAQYLRLDIFNIPMTKDCYIDIAYIGITDDISKVFELEKLQTEPCEDIKVFGANNAYVAYDLDGVEIEKADSAPSVSTGSSNKYIPSKNDHDFKPSTNSYVSGIDFINGLGDGDANDPAYNAYRSSDAAGPKVINFDGATVGNAYLVVAGWTLVHGGIEGVESYYWSADGGKTWHNIEMYPATKVPAAAAGGIKDAGDGHFKTQVAGFDPETYDQANYAHAVYQGAANNPAGIAAHLTDYVGKEVDVTFAVVPKAEPGTLCIIAHVQNVRVYASDADADAGEACDHTKPASSYTFIDDGNNNTDKAVIVKTCKCGEKVIETIDPSFVLFFNTVGTNPNVQPTVFENSKGYRIIDASTYAINGTDKSFKANASGILQGAGWMGANGGIADIAYRVYDSKGNELTNGWVSAGATIKDQSKDPGISAEMIKRNIESAYAASHSFSIDLSSFFANNEKLTVQLALVASGAPKNSNDKYIYAGEFTNIAKASQ